MALPFDDIDLSPLGGRKRFDAAFGIANKLFPDSPSKVGFGDALLHMGRGISAGAGSGLSGTARLGMGMTGLSDEFLRRRAARKELEQRRAQLAMNLLPMMEQREGRLFNQDLQDRRLAWDMERFGLQQDQRESEFARRLGFDEESLAQAETQFRDRLGLDTDRFGFEQERFGVESAQAQARIDNQAKQFAERLGYDYDSLSQADKQFFANQARMSDEFAVTSDQGQQRIDQAGQQFEDRLGFDRESLAQAQGQFEDRLGFDRERFGVESAQAQERIDNQAAQAAQRLGYDWATLDQNSKQFFIREARAADEFDRRLAFDETGQVIGDQQFWARLGQEGEQFDRRLAFDEAGQVLDADQFDRRLALDEAGQVLDADQFDRRLAFDEAGQVLDADQFDRRLAFDEAGQVLDAEQFGRRLAQDADQFAVTTDLAQQRITQAAEQFGKTHALDQDKFAIDTEMSQQKLDLEWEKLGLDRTKFISDLNKEDSGMRGGTESERDMSALMRIASKGDYNTLSPNDKLEFDMSMNRLEGLSNITITDPDDPTKEITIPWSNTDIVGMLSKSHPDFMATYTGGATTGGTGTVLFPEVTGAEADARLGDRLGTGRPTPAMKFDDAMNDMALADKLGGEVPLEDRGYDFSYLTGRPEHDVNELFRRIGAGEPKWSQDEIKALHPKTKRTTVIEPVTEPGETRTIGGRNVPVISTTGETRVIGGREVPVLDKSTKKMEITAARRVAMGKLSLSAIDTASEVLFPDGKWGGWTTALKGKIPWTQAGQAYNTYSTAVNQFLREQSGAVINDREYAYADGLFVPKWYDSQEKASQRREMLRQYWTTMIEQLHQNPDGVVMNVTAWAKANPLAQDIEKWDAQQGLGNLTAMPSGGFQQPAPPGEGQNTTTSAPNTGGTPEGNQAWLDYINANK